MSSNFSFMSPLNSGYLFENFVVGKANQVAHAAAAQACNFHRPIYNPLYIYGGTGVGKTHLIQAVGNQIKKENS